MQIILIKPVRKIGKIGETIDVKNGYARNFLIPQFIAVKATKKNIAKFAELKKELEIKNNQEILNMEKAAKILDGKDLTFVTQSGPDGRLFGSISLKSIASSLSTFIGYKLSCSNIILESPIRSNGIFEIKVMLHPEIFASVLVVVAKSELEAQDALEKYKKKKESSSNFIEEKA